MRKVNTPKYCQQCSDVLERENPAVIFSSLIIYSVNIKPPRHPFGLSLCLGLAIILKSLNEKLINQTIFSVGDLMLSSVEIAGPSTHPSMPDTQQTTPNQPPHYLQAPTIQPPHYVPAPTNQPPHYVPAHAIPHQLMDTQASASYWLPVQDYSSSLAIPWQPFLHTTLTNSKH